MQAPVFMLRRGIELDMGRPAAKKRLPGAAKERRKKQDWKADDDPGNPEVPATTDICN